MKTRSAYNPNIPSGLNYGLKFYTRFDSSSVDAINNLAGTDTSVTYSAGLIGNGAVFNATSDKIVWSGFTTFPTTGDFSINIWINPSSLLSNYDSIGGANSGTDSWHINMNTNTTMWFDHYDNSTDKNVNFSGTFSTSTWYMLTVVRFGDSITTYVNGANPTTTTGWATRNFGTASTGLRLGQARTGTALPATYDEIGLWNRVLSTTEITALYNSAAGFQLPTNSPALKAYYPLNGNSTDYSGNRNTGTDTAITYPQGKFGQAAKFNGTTSNIANTFFQNPTLYDSGLSISCWFRLDATPTGDVSIFGFGDSGWGGIFLTVRSLTQLWWRFGNGITSDGGGNSALNIPSLSVGVWHNWIMVHSASGSFVYLDSRYIDTRTYFALTNTTTALTIGASVNGALSVDEVIIESRAWTPAEVSTYYRKSMLNYGVRKSWFNSLGLSVLLNEVITASEVSVTAIKGKLVQLLETITASEVVTSLKGKVVSLLETITASEIVQSVVKRFMTNETRNSATPTQEGRNSATLIQEDKHTM